MRRLIACLIVATVAFHTICVAAAESASPETDRAYTFTLNGQPFQPRIISLNGDPEHPMPGDLIAVDNLLLTLGKERECHFVILSKYGHDWDRVFLQLPDGRRSIVGVCVTQQTKNDKTFINNPLQKLSPDEIHGLWGICLNVWSDEITKHLQNIDPARTCITLEYNALIPDGEKDGFPPLPKHIQYLNTRPLCGNIKSYAPLQHWKELRFLSLSRGLDVVFDARWLAANASLRHLELRNCMIEHPEALSQLDRLESLDLSHVRNLATIAFVEKLPRLRCLDLTDTAVWELSELGKHKTLAKLNISQSKVRDLSELKTINLEELFLDETMIRDLSPLSRLKKMTTISQSILRLINCRPIRCRRCAL